MSTTLRVFVGERWPEKPSTRWVLLDAAGEVQQQGESDALRWPVADYCEAVISAPEVSCLRGAVPKRASARDLPRIAAGVFEDRLLEDPDRCHLTIAGRHGDEVEALVVSRTRLRNILTQFSALNRPLVAAFSELQSVPTATGGWIVALAADAAILNRPAAAPTVLDSPDDGAPPPLLGAFVGKDAAPAVTLLSEPGKAIDLSAWREALPGGQASVGPEHRWYALPGNAANLLHGEFASRLKKNNWWLLVRPAALTAAAALAAYLVVGLMQLSWLAYRTSATEARMAELFRSAFPSVPVVAPQAQTRRQLDLLRAKHGLARSDDALVLLAALVDVLGPGGDAVIKEMKYADHRLTLVMERSVAPRLDALSRGLQDRGYRAIAMASPDRPSLSIDLDASR